MHQFPRGRDGRSGVLLGRIRQAALLLAGPRSRFEPSAITVDHNSMVAAAPPIRPAQADINRADHACAYSPPEFVNAS